MSKYMEFYIQNDAASIQIGKNVYRRVSIPIDDFNAACEHYGFVKERTCQIEHPYYGDAPVINGQPRCSECKTEFTVGTFPNYCPNCGARVVGE